MNIFAGNIVIAGDGVVELEEFDYIESFSNTGEKSVYIFGETQMNTSVELIADLESKIGKIYHYNMSISTEDAVGVVPYDYEAGVYECSAFEGENIRFDEITERFEDIEGVFAIREAEVSPLFGNRVVRVDFIY